MIADDLPHLRLHSRRLVIVERAHIPDRNRHRRDNVALTRCLAAGLAYLCRRSANHHADVVRQPRLPQLLAKRIKDPHHLIDRAVTQLLAEDLRRMPATSRGLELPRSRTPAADALHIFPIYKSARLKLQRNVTL